MLVLLVLLAVLGAGFCDGHTVRAAVFGNCYAHCCDANADAVLLVLVASFSSVLDWLYFESVMDGYRVFGL